MKRILMITLMLGLLVVAACGAEPTSTPAPTAVPVEPTPTTAPGDTTLDSPLDMANPASTFCVEQGYELEIRDEVGGQIGYCLFPDGSECEEWAFYASECGPEAEGQVGLPNPASAFCVDQGYKLETRDEAGGQVGYCLFPNGAECEEWAFFRGECSPPESYP